MTDRLTPEAVAAAHGWTPPGDDPEPRTRRFRAVPYSEIRRERVEWLVPGRVPLGAVSILAGEPGLGKSLYSIALAARLSRNDVASLVLSAEDSEGATIRPRLDACEAASGLVHSVRLLDGDEGDGLALPADAAMLDELIVETSARLVVVDPVVAYLDGGIDSHKDASVRQALAPLARIAAARSCAVLAILHVNKALGSDWYRRLSGSGGFGGAARSVLLFGRDPDDSDRDRGTGRLLAHAKCNVAELAPSQQWSLAPILLSAAGDERETRTARIEIVGESDHGYRTLLDASSDPDERLPRDEAEAFLRVELAGGPRPAKDIERAARDAGISSTTLRRARAALGITSHKSGFSGGWEWTLPEDAHPERDDDEWTPSQERHGYAESDPSEPSRTAEDAHVSKVDAFAHVETFDPPSMLLADAEYERLRRKFPDVDGEAA
jgi:hypothetical protein